MIDFRDLLCTELQAVPITLEDTMLIAEVRTSGRFAGERSQLVLELIRVHETCAQNVPDQEEGYSGTMESWGETFVAQVENTSQYASAYSDLAQSCRSGKE